MTGCSTAHGITRVGTSGQEVIAEALSVSDDQNEGYSYFSSRDGGKSWSPSASATEVQWSEGPVDTPEGTYQIEGPGILLTKSDGQTETVYSVAHWNSSSNRWYQAEQTQHLKDRALATQPTAITYDRDSGNLIAGMGIQGVAVGASDGQWVPVTVGEYSPISYSRELKLRELLRQNAFWITVFLFPVTMIALAFFFRDLLHRSVAKIAAESRNQRAVGIKVFIPFMAFVGILVLVSCAVVFAISGLWMALLMFALPAPIAAIFFRIASQSTVQSLGCLVMFFSMPCTVLAILISASFLAGFGRADIDASAPDGIETAFAFISLIAAISGSTIAWRRQWRIRWWVIVAGYTAMVAFVAFLFLGWVLSEVSVLWPRLASLVLCLATALVVYRAFRVEHFSCMQDMQEEVPASPS